MKFAFKKLDVGQKAVEFTVDDIDELNEIGLEIGAMIKGLINAVQNKI